MKNTWHARLGLALICLPWISIGSAVEADDNVGSPQLGAGDTAVLQNDQLSLAFQRKTGALRAIENKLAGETYHVEGDAFEIDADQFHTGLADARLVGLVVEANTLKADYRSNDLTIQVLYSLRANFVEKQATLTSPRDYGLRNLIVSKPCFAGPEMKMVAYRHPKLELQGKSNAPSCTFFGRTAKGGIFLGVELSFDRSKLEPDNAVSLAYAPNLKIKANEKVVCDPVYLGVYRKRGQEKEETGLPLASESDAMVTMTSAILPPPSRPRLGPLMCGWCSEMWRNPYTTMKDVERDTRSIDFAVDCGIDIISDARTWAGETDKVNSLRNGDKLQFGELPLKLAAHAREKGVRWMFWSSMGNSDPWWEQGKPPGKPFRPDKPEWRMTPYSATCFAYQPSYDWLVGITLDAVEAGQYGAWCIDGDFFGGPGFDGGPGWNGAAGPNGEPGEPWVHPARCQSTTHGHLSPDINYNCQCNLTEMAKVLRQRHPELYMFYCRPAMDLGVWALRYVDACFTINEWASLDALPGIEPQPRNVLLGDKIRHWSRVRVHHHFFPHYLDSPLVFDAPKSMSKRDWTSEKIDYIMLSALSSSPNQTYYLPSQAGIPAADKQEIKKWLDWGRKHIGYLMVRKDLPDWPAAGKIDGSAHVVGDRGYVFLFNPNPRSLDGVFPLTQEGIGLGGQGRFRVAQCYPASEKHVVLSHGEDVQWQIPGQTAVILEVRKEDN